MKDHLIKILLFFKHFNTIFRIYFIIEFKILSILILIVRKKGKTKKKNKKSVKENCKRIFKFY